MNTEQITNIAVRVGEIGIQSDIAFWVAIIGAVAAIIAAGVAAISSHKISVLNKEHEKQWAYTIKLSIVVENAIEIFSRMLFNKLLIAYHGDKVAYQNLFLLQKDILVIESQLVIYSPSIELANAVNEFKNIIVNTPDAEFIKKWDDIYTEGHKLLILCKNQLGKNITEKFEDFSKKLITIPPSRPESFDTIAGSLGEVMKKKSIRNKGDGSI